MPLGEARAVPARRPEALPTPGRATTAKDSMIMKAFKRHGNAMTRKSLHDHAPGLPGQRHSTDTAGTAGLGRRGIPDLTAFGL